jgi:hypothetical protein
MGRARPARHATACSGRSRPAWSALTRPRSVTPGTGRRSAAAAGRQQGHGGGDDAGRGSRRPRPCPPWPAHDAGAVVHQALLTSWAAAARGRRCASHLAALRFMGPSVRVVRGAAALPGLAGASASAGLVRGRRVPATDLRTPLREWPQPLGRRRDSAVQPGRPGRDNGTPTPGAGCASIRSSSDRSGAEPLRTVAGG